jgi:hypothetical protein
VEKVVIKGLEINRVPLKTLLFNKKMLLAWFFLAFALLGIVEVFYERYFLMTANAWDAAANPGSREIAEAMKEAVFGSGGEVKREAPWTLYIVNYMYMLYSGSGIIFLVSLAELLGIEMIKKTAAGFITLGMAMIFAGLFTISSDLNILHLKALFFSSNKHAAMWMMLPLYFIYIPLILFELYLLLTKNYTLAKKVAVPVLIMSLLAEVAEYYIQSTLFSMNEARHLWTTYPFITLYFLISSIAVSAALMLLYAFFIYRKQFDEEHFRKLIRFLKKIALYSVVLLGAYEATAYLFVDKRWAQIILFGDFRWYFFAYIIFAIGIPFLLLYREHGKYTLKILAALCIVIGSYLGRMIFVYGGNAYPMSDRFGVGFEKYSEYEPVKEMVFFLPSQGEIFICLGSIGIVLAVYTIFDTFFDVSKVRGTAL